MTIRRHCMIVFSEYPLGETRVQRQAEALIRNGYDVDVICKRLPGQKNEDRYKGVRIFREKYHFNFLGINPESLWQRFFDYCRFFFSAAVRLNSLSAKKKYDSIQVHNLPDFLVFCTYFQKRRGVPVILDLHDLMPEFFAGRFGSGSALLAKLIRWQERISCKYADHVITVSKHWRQALVQRGVPAKKCSVVMNVADSNIFQASVSSPQSIPRDHGLRMIYHGTMVYRYGLDLAVHAVSRLATEIPGIHLSLVGQGEFLPDIVKLVDQLHLKSHVSIEPSHLVEELPGIILANDLGIVPYRNDIFTDGLLPTKLMEYASLGIPVVASKTTAIQAYFNGMNVEFFEPGDLDDLVQVIRSLNKNPDRMEDLRDGCEIYNKNYDWSRISAEYVALVQGLRQHERASFRDG
jgi:glycosyltransferase involved in cell wall biosynthesis